ncbi:hypothetical protein TNCV_4530101 [Trichonephila clavipes]|nr:hypothetical protein TNCV_4530101 [Trichonephila clavipes]
MQEQDIEELESLNPIQSEDGMTEGLSSVEKELQILKNIDPSEERIISTKQGLRGVHRFLLGEGSYILKTRRRKRREVFFAVKICCSIDIRVASSIPLGWKETASLEYTLKQSFCNHIFPAMHESYRGNRDY